MLSDWESMPERAPSIIRADTPTLARTFALIGFFLLAVGAIALMVAAWNASRESDRAISYLVGPTWGLVFGTTGLALILAHAFADKEVQFRRLYGFFAIVMLLLAVVLRVLPTRTGFGAWFLPYGVPLMAIGFLLTLAVLRNETDDFWRTLLLRLIGALGAVMILAGVGVGLIQADFVPGEGIVLILLGTCFVGGFIGMQGIGSDLGYYAGVALGVFAVAVFLLAALRALTTRDYFVPSGLTLIAASLLHLGLALGICSDSPFAVLTRRELAAYFYSPIAYLVLAGSVVAGGIWFAFIMTAIIQFGQERGPVEEPIMQHYLGSLVLVIIQMAVVPALTMRLLSEEKRSGTLEMLLTTPVNESSIILAKFAAVWIFWLITWVPYFLFPVALRLVVGEEFEYRPMLSYGFGLLATGAGFLAMGLFFSAITRNQIIAAILTFVGMIVHLSMHLLSLLQPPETWSEILRYVSFFDLWSTFIRGTFAPRYLVFHVSLAIFFLFISVKVLEARKWK
jgi:ABC-type transport system involved in multi-copper enzyme maturation permease subunit